MPRKASVPYERLYDPTHPLAATSGFVATHRKVLYEKIGPGPHPCHWCGHLAHWGTAHERSRPANRRLEAYHLDRHVYHNVPENLVPVCHSCNFRRQSGIQEGELFVARGNGKRVRAEQRTCKLCGKSFLFARNQRNQGFFCSRACARQFRLIFGHHPLVKLSAADIRCIRQMDGTMTQAEIGAKFGIAQDHVSKIIHRKRWAHVD